MGGDRRMEISKSNQLIWLLWITLKLHVFPKDMKRYKMRAQQSPLDHWISWNRITHNLEKQFEIHSNLSLAGPGGSFLNFDVDDLFPFHDVKLSCFFFLWPGGAPLPSLKYPSTLLAIRAAFCCVLVRGFCSTTFLNGNFFGVTIFPCVLIVLFSCCFDVVVVVCIVLCCVVLCSVVVVDAIVLSAIQEFQNLAILTRTFHTVHVR